MLSMPVAEVFVISNSVSEEFHVHAHICKQIINLYDNISR